MKALVVYDWPGNVRELENCIERCCAMNSSPVIRPADLPGSIRGASVQPVNGRPEGKIAPIVDLEKQAILGAIGSYTGTS